MFTFKCSHSYSPMCCKRIGHSDPPQRTPIACYRKVFSKRPPDGLLPCGSMSFLTDQEALKKTLQV